MFGIKAELVDELGKKCYPAAREGGVLGACGIKQERVGDCKKEKLVDELKSGKARERQ